MRFGQAATTVADALGSPWATLVATASVLVWAGGGLVMGFGDRYVAAANITISIVTYLMVFVLQASTRRAERALQLKVSELVRASPEARTARFADLEDATDEEVEACAQEFEALRARRQR